jgi:DNA invertase Pin-like site-specific DNA recombinase
MKQSNSRKGRSETAHLYLRLSRDDKLDGESYSIKNQKQLLTKVANEKGYTKLRYHIDDGISGVTMDRPGFTEMTEEIESGIGSAVFVKDMSRLGRNYLQVGYYTDEFFPEYDIRLIAVSDGIDSDEGENEIAPIKNVFNEWYSRDISRKRRYSLRVKGNSGVPLGPPPYGYVKDPADPKHWVVDEEAATVVRRIYQMSIDGLGTEQIAAALTKERIPTPVYYWEKNGIRRPSRRSNKTEYNWNSSTIIKILHLQEYLGDVINFKTYSKSFKNKKRIENDKENMAIFEGVHEPVIEREVWARVQAKRGKIRKRKKRDGEVNIFSGLLKCADCGGNLWYHFNQGNHEIKYFNCSNYKGNSGDCGSTHYIRLDFLEKVTLAEVRRLTRFAAKYESDFMQIVMEHAKTTDETERHMKRKELSKLSARHEEIDLLFDKMYEDNVSGRISDERFATMSRRYENNQSELSKRIESLESELEQTENNAVSAEAFMKTVRKYTRAKKLTRAMLHSLIERIDVYHAEKGAGKHEQKLIIHWACVGNIDLPKGLKLPEADVEIRTRQGVAVSYAAGRAV